jgi:type IV secretory pathway VirB2 component (pilin)
MLVIMIFTWLLSGLLGSVIAIERLEFPTLLPLEAAAWYIVGMFCGPVSLLAAIIIIYWT